MLTMLTKDEWCSVREAAKVIGCTEGRVRQLLIDGIIAGQKLNKRAWAVAKHSAKLFADAPQGTGRPRKNSA